MANAKNEFEKEPTLTDIMGFLQETVATKEDLKGFATKDDLKGFATKEDLKGFATKDDLKGFATKADLRIMQQEILDGVDDKLVNLKGDLVVIIRKGDHKVVSLISLLQDKKVISAAEAKALLTLEPFPQRFV